MKLSRRKFLGIAGTGAGVLAAPGFAAMMVGRKEVETHGRREESLWTAQAPPIPPAPELKGSLKLDLAIVGGGFTGLSCAYYAKKLRPDWSVAVLESHRLGSGASSRNSGAVSAGYRGMGRNAMARRGFDRLLSFIGDEAIDCDFRGGGVLELLSSGSDSKRASKSAGPDARWVPAEELEKVIGSRYYAGAVETRDYSTLDPAKLVAGHVRAARQKGVQLYENSPVLEVRKGKPAELLTPTARVQADRVFIAANAYTPRLGFLKYVMMPVHQYTLATRKLTEFELTEFGLSRWPLRFERGVLPVTTHLTPSGHFFIRIVLGYSSFNSCEWRDMDGARRLAKKMFVQRYPWIADVELEHGWHGVTGHTLKQREVACPIMGESIHISAAYNGLGIMPGHNNGYLTACRMTGHDEEDVRYLAGTAGHYPLPGEYYRSLIFKPFMKIMTPA